MAPSALFAPTRMKSRLTTPCVWYRGLRNPRSITAICGSALGVQLAHVLRAGGGVARVVEQDVAHRLIADHLRHDAEGVGDRHAERGAGACRAHRYPDGNLCKAAARPQRKRQAKNLLHWVSS